MNFEQSRVVGAGERVIPLGTQTLSKSPTQFVQGVRRSTSQRGQGAHVWDVDGNEYIDYPMALGPMILGYAEPVVDDAIRAQLADGITFTLMHPLEVEVAERIVAHVPRRRGGAVRQDGLRRAERRGPGGPAPSPDATSCSSPATTAGTTGTSARRRAAWACPRRSPS